MTYGYEAYGAAEEAPAPQGDVSVSADLTASGALRYTEAPPPTALTGESTLYAGAVPGRAGGSQAAVEVTPEGLGTKVLQGATAVVLVQPEGAGVRVPPYNAHPNTREDTNYVPAGNVALATLLRDERREPPSGEGRQLVLLGAAPSTTTPDEDDSIFEIDHRG